MSAFITENFAAVALGVLIAGIALAVLCAALLSSRVEKRQARALDRLRRDANQQSEAVARMGEGLSAALRQIEAMSDSMEARQDRMRRTLDERMELMNQANERRLGQMRELVTEKLDGRLNESFTVIGGQLENVHRGLGQMRELATGLTDLKKLLGGVKTRGVWGEVQLRSLLNQLFAPGQVVENAAIPEGSMTRVEFALRLPAGQAGELLLPIDSKFPVEDYLRLMEAGDAGDAERARRSAIQLERAVLEQAKRISDRYIRPPQTTDYAVLFLPTESLYAEVARLDGLIERTQEKYRVLVAGPATLSALLTSLQLGARTLTLERRSGEVLNLLSGMKADFADFDDAIQRMRRRLAQTEAELNTLEQKARKVVRAMEGVGESQ